MDDIFLLDTSFVVAFLGRDVPTPVRVRMEQLVSEDSAATNALIRTEVLVGCRNPEDYERVSVRMQALQSLPLENFVWERASRLGFDLTRVGLSVGVSDLVIAATALHNQATLLHMDSDFELIAQHSDLRTESYLDIA